MSAVKIFVPDDAAALALGADKVARAIAAEAEKRGLEIQIVRNGSRGMAWLEPLVEVQTTQGRIGYGPVSAADVAELFEAGFLDGGAHALCIGKPEDHPFLLRQTRGKTVVSAMKMSATGSAPLSDSTPVNLVIMPDGPNCTSHPKADVRRCTSARPCSTRWSPAVPACSPAADRASAARTPCTSTAAPAVWAPWGRTNAPRWRGWATAATCAWPV